MRHILFKYLSWTHNSCSCKLHKVKTKIILKLMAKLKTNIKIFYCFVLIIKIMVWTFLIWPRLSEANRPNLKTKSLMRFAIIDWVKVNQWKLSEFLGPYFKYCLRFPDFVSASVQQDIGLVVQSWKLFLVVSLQFDGIVVVTRPGVKPGGGVDAGVGEVLVGLLAQ